MQDRLHVAGCVHGGANFGRHSKPTDKRGTVLVSTGLWRMPGSESRQNTGPVHGCNYAS